MRRNRLPLACSLALCLSFALPHTLAQTTKLTSGGAAFTLPSFESELLQEINFARTRPLAGRPCRSLAGLTGQAELLADLRLVEVEAMALDATVADEGTPADVVGGATPPRRSDGPRPRPKNGLDRYFEVSARRSTVGPSW